MVQGKDAITAAKQQEGPVEELDEDMWQRIYRKKSLRSLLMNSCYMSQKRNRGMVEAHADLSSCGNGTD